MGNKAAAIFGALLYVSIGLSIDGAKAQPACSTPTWPAVFPTGAYRWDEVKVNIPAGTRSVRDQLRYRPPSWAKVCWAKYDEFSGNPPMGTRFSISRDQDEFVISYTLPCPQGNVPIEGFAAAAGAAVSVYAGGNPQIGAAAGVAIASAVSGDCGVGGPRSWLDAQWAFVLVNKNSQCYSTMPCDARPWIDLRGGR